MCVMTDQSDLCTKLLTISNEFSPWSIGTKCPASFTVLNSKFPTILWKPATFPLTFHGCSNVSLNRSTIT